MQSHLFQRPYIYAGILTVKEGTVTMETRRCKLAKMALMASIGAIILLSAIAGSAEDRKTRAITFLSSGTYTAQTSYSTAFDVSAYAEGQVFINVTAEADTSTLDVTVQTSPDNLTWYTHTTVAQITGTGQYRAAVTNFGNYLRIKHIVGGTSFTNYRYSRLTVGCS